MMIFTSIYWIVDGFFISNFIGTSAFAGVNIIFPIVMIVACLGFMFGSGGAALVSKRLGEQNQESANNTFSLITYVAIGVGVSMGILFFFLIRPIAQGFASINNVNATDEMVNTATKYGRIMLAGVGLYVLQSYFHSFFSVNEKSFLGFLFTLAAGLTNMFMDFLLIGVFKLGVEGAAIASLTGMLVGSIGPLLYFIFGKHNLIKLGKATFVLRDIFQTMLNGSSEFVSNVSGSIITTVYNIQLLKYIGEDGVAAYGVIGYVCFVFFAIFIGYSMGIAPVIAYNYGAKNKEELTNVLRKSFAIVEIAGIIMTILAISLSGPIAYIFTNSSPDLHKLATKAMRIFSICYLFTGYSMFGSSFFTALNNGLLSAIIAVCRTLVFQMAAVFILPLIMGVDGIWYSIIVAEVLSMIMTIILIGLHGKKYGYKMSPFRPRTT